MNRNCQITSNSVPTQHHYRCKNIMSLTKVITRGSNSITGDIMVSSRDHQGPMISSISNTSLLNMATTNLISPDWADWPELLTYHCYIVATCRLYLTNYNKFGQIHKQSVYIGLHNQQCYSFFFQKGCLNIFPSCWIACSKSFTLVAFISSCFEKLLLYLCM